MGAASGSEAIRTVQEVLLVDGLQHLAHGVLDQLVLERRDANWPRLPLGFGDVDTSDRLMAIPLRLQPRVQVLEVRLQALSVLLLGDPIHPYRRVCTLAAIGSLAGPAHRSDAPVSGTVLRVRVSLFPLPSKVLVTCLPMSRHWAWFPPEVHLNTGRLCSAGSGCHAVPRRHRSYAALRLPAPFGHGSGSPCLWPPSMRTLVLCHLWADDTCARRRVVRRRRVTGSPLRPGYVEERRGPPRLLDRPLRTCRGRTPRRIHSPPRPENSRRRLLLPSGNPGPSASGKTIGFGAAVPRPARSHAYASPVLFPRPAQGLLPARAGSPLAGRDLHPLDDKRSFMKSSHPPIPFDQQGLVALHFLSAHRSTWHHLLCNARTTLLLRPT